MQTKLSPWRNTTAFGLASNLFRSTWYISSTPVGKSQSDSTGETGKKKTSVATSLLLQKIDNNDEV
jgi:hypothetical protein